MEYNSCMNKKGKSIIIGSDSLNFLPDVDNVYSCYRSYGFFARVGRKIIKTLKLFRFISYFYGGWKKRLNNCDMVILFDGGVDNVDLISSHIKRINPSLRLVFWFWNPVKPKDIALNSKYIDEVWTYSRFDAEKYHLKYNPQFYSKMVNINKSGENLDLVFMGADKGRRKTLDYLRKNANSQGLKCGFRIVESKKDRVDYQEYLSVVMDSKCVVDVVPDRICGLTLRPLEALFYEKKLITNYEDIVNYDFYRKENIFVIGKDNMDKMAEFVNGPYKKIDEKIINYYCYEKWLKRIEDNKDVKV